MDLRLCAVPISINNSRLITWQAFANWTMVGGFSLLVSLSMAEIAAALPTTGGIYFWSYKLGGVRHGRFLSWLTAWYNWAGLYSS